MTDLMLTLLGVACLVGGFGILAIALIAYLESLVIRLDVDSLT